MDPWTEEPPRGGSVLLRELILPRQTTYHGRVAEPHHHFPQTFLTLSQAACPFKGTDILQLPVGSPEMLPIEQL